MNPVLRDKCWARRFGRTPGDLGIVRPLRRDRIQIAIWRPQQMAQKVSRVTVPKPLPTCAISPTLPPSGRVGRQSMAVNAQADARHVSTPTGAPMLGTAAHVRGGPMGLKPNAPKPEIQHRPLPPYSNTPAAAHAAEDWFDGPECAAILAQPVEPCTENPFAGDCEPSEIDA